jgi:hypothetical protein
MIIALNNVGMIALNEMNNLFFAYEFNKNVSCFIFTHLVNLELLSSER